MFTGIGCLRANPNCLQTPSASSNRSAKSITSADSNERAKRRDLYETGIALWLSSVRRTVRQSCDDNSALLANAAPLYAGIRYDLWSGLRIRISALW